MDAICYRCTQFSTAETGSYCAEKDEYNPETTQGGFDLTKCDLFEDISEKTPNCVHAVGMLIVSFKYCPDCGEKLR